MIKPFILLLAWFAGGALAVLAFLVVFAPYLGSVISNIGRRPVAPTRPARRTHHAQRSPAH